MVAKKEVLLHPLVKNLFEELKKRRVSVPDFSNGTGIPSARIYKWKQQGTAPKNDDAQIIKEWIKLDIYPSTVIKKEDDISTLMSSHEERLLRIEAHLEVFENAIAGLLAENKSDFAKKVGELRREVQGAVNRRFDELQKKLSGH